MILKASQRGGAADLAVHLMRADENEHVEIHELRGFASETLKDAFKETDAISRATQCHQYLFSLSLSPPEREHVPIETFQDAIDRIEARLGLTGQPRAVVFHEKEGRRHAHCVWSRIDAQTLTAKPLPFFKNKLMEVSRDLYLEHGWAMPRGIAEKGNRNPTNFTLAEWQQAKRQGIDPRWIKTTLQQCWKTSDNAAALARAVEERGFILAKGDKAYAGSRHLMTVRNLIAGRGYFEHPDTDERVEGMDALLAEMEFNRALGGLIRDAAYDFSEKPERERGSVLSTARRHIRFLSYGKIGEAVSGHDFELADLKRGKLTVYSSRR